MLSILIETLSPGLAGVLSANFVNIPSYIFVNPHSSDGTEVPVPVTVISATMRAVRILPKLSSIFASIVYFPDSVNE